MGSSTAPADALLNAALLHFLQSHTGIPFRHGIAAGLASVVNALVERSPAPGQGSFVPGWSRQLQDQGYAPLGQVLTAEQAAAVAGYLETRPCFNGPVPEMSDSVPRDVRSQGAVFAYGSHKLADVVAAPVLLELANRPEILALADAYLGCTPTLYAVHAWWSFPGARDGDPVGFFRRDVDDYKFCTLLLHLTEPGPEEAPLEYIRHSHRLDFIQRALADAGDTVRRAGRSLRAEDLFQPGPNADLDSLYAALFRGAIDRLAGAAGSAFMFDASGLHRIAPPRTRRRLTFAARYGLYRNMYSVQAGDVRASRQIVGSRLPRDTRTDYINRCIVSPDS